MTTHKFVDLYGTQSVPEPGAGLVLLMLPLAFARNRA